VLAAVIATAWPVPLQAQTPQEADGLVRDTYETIRDQALRPPDLLTLLHQTVLTAQRALTASGIAEPPPLPPFTGEEAHDLTAAAAYVQGAVAAVPHDAERILAAVLRSMVKTMTDPQGAVFVPLEFVHYQREVLRGEHSGIGAQVDAARGQIIIFDVTAGGPAARAGLRPGDALLEVDGRSVAGRTPDQVLQRLHGAAGTPVSLVVRRRDGGLLRLSIPREVSRENPTRWRMLEPRIGYLRLLEFTEGASFDVGRGLSGLTGAGAAALLLDLRENGGGLLDEAIGVASAFLADGIVAMEERRGTLNPLTVTPQALRFSGSVVVLVSGFTASASEIVAGALQDTGTPLVGTRTFGKGTVQTIYPMRAGWGLRLTTARYFTRRGRHIDGVGLQPDLRVAMDDEQIQTPEDVQLLDAMSLLRSRMAAGTGGRP